jgi:hypothetical protein
MSLTKKELGALSDLAYEAFVGGLSSEDVRDSLALPEDEFKLVLIHMFDTKAEEVRTRPTEHTYVQYVIDQHRNISDLTTIIGHYETTRNHSAMVSAIKARSDIQSKVLNQGQEFGIVASSPEENGNLVAGVVVTEMTNVDLKTALLRELSEAKRMMSEFGDSDFSRVEIGELHRGPALPPAPEVVVDRSKKIGKDPSAPKPKPKKKKQRFRIATSDPG